jgi:hypothetical protein
MLASLPSTDLESHPSRFANPDSEKRQRALKALYALSDAIALGASPTDIRDGSSFLTAAKYAISGDDD